MGMGVCAGAGAGVVGGQVGLVQHNLALLALMLLLLLLLMLLALMSMLCRTHVRPPNASARR